MLDEFEACIETKWDTWAKCDILSEGSWHLLEGAWVLRVKVLWEVSLTWWIVSSFSPGLSLPHLWSLFPVSKKARTHGIISKRFGRDSEIFDDCRAVSILWTAFDGIQTKLELFHELWASHSKMKQLSRNSALKHGNENRTLCDKPQEFSNMCWGFSKLYSAHPSLRMDGSVDPYKAKLQIF